MPEVDAFLKVFNLQQGSRVAGYTITHVSARHESVVKYREYVYHIHIEFEALNMSSKPNELYSGLDSLIKDSRVVKSAYGNPYRCSIDTDYTIHTDNQGYAQVSLVGHSYRV